MASEQAHYAGGRAPAHRRAGRAGASVRSSATTCASRSGAATAATTTCCSTSRTGRRDGASPGRRCSRRGRSRTSATSVGVNRIGKDGNGATYAGDSAAFDFLGQSLGGDHGGDFVETVVLDREALQKYRESFPAHLDADDFELWTGCGRAMKNAHARHAPARGALAAGQPAARRADLPVGQVHVRRRRADARALQAPARGLLLLAHLEPDAAATRAVARRIAGARRLPADGLRRRGASRCRCSRCCKTGRPRRLFRRACTSRRRSSSGACCKRYGVTSTMLSIDDVDGARARARGHADPARRLRVADESRAQGRGPRAASRRSRGSTAR